MTPAPTDKPLHIQLEEAEKSLESMEKSTPHSGHCMSRILI